MSLMNMPVFAALSQKMQWHQTRQGLLAENIANAETPGYGGRDLRAFSFDGAGARSLVQVATTQPMHFSVGGAGAAAGINAQRMANFEVTPEGNGVTLEDEMMKVTGNMMDFQAATTLYQKSVKILRTALGRSA